MSFASVGLLPSLYFIIGSLLQSRCPMKSPAPIGLLFLVLTVVTNVQCRGAEDPTQDSAAVGPPVLVQLIGGRTMAGDLGPQTNADELWLQAQRGSTAILRPIQWDQVAKAWVIGYEFSGDELRRIAAKIREHVPAPARVFPSAITLRENKGTGTSPHVSFPANDLYDSEPVPIFSQTLRGHVGSQEVADSPRRQAPHVRQLAIDANVANWNDTVEADGLTIHVYPLDAEGRVVPVHGTLEVDLTGRQLTVTRPSQPQPFANVGRWTQTVRPEDFGPRGAVYHLPFQSVQPDFDLTVAPAGVVHARLGVPGQGTFDTTQSTVRIRPASAVRDDLERSSGQRFFPDERTERGRLHASSTSSH